MTEIQITAYQCDFCSVKALQMDECILCGKHMCEKHSFNAGVEVSIIRQANNKEFYKFKRIEHVCQECGNDKPNLLRKIALVLENEALRIESEPPPEEP